MSKQQTKKADAVAIRKDTVMNAIGDKSIADTVFNKIAELEQQGGLTLPPNYAPGNALKSAWLIFQDSTDLMKCSDGSKANALLDTVIQGLSPSKNQCYYIPYGNKAKMQRSYLGNVAVTKNLAAVKDVDARVIYQGEIDNELFKFGMDTDTMRFKILKHDKDMKYIDPDKVAGAYGIIYRTDGTVDISEPMTKKQIVRAWEQGSMKGKSGAHSKFGEEMSKKTVLNRHCKMYFNTSNDSDLLAESVNRTAAIADIPEAEAEVIQQDEIDENTATKEIDVTVKPEDVKQPEQEEVKEESVFDKGTKEAKKDGPGF